MMTEPTEPTEKTETLEMTCNGCWKMTRLLLSDDFPENCPVCGKADWIGGI